MPTRQKALLQMQLLAEQIESVLKTERQCFVRPDQLKRVWPSLANGQCEDAVREFAREHGWRIFTYSRVLGAMFVRDSTASLGESKR